VIYAQILIGATMRHTGAGLAIPDFPLSFGHVIPPYWDSKIAIHFAHRVGAATVTVLIGATTGHVFFHHARRAELRRPAILLLVLLVLQITLGAITVLGNKPFIINSLHVVNGALVLVTSLVLTLRAHRSRFAQVARAFLPDDLSDEAPRAKSEARRAKSGEVRDATKGYGGARA